MNWQQEVTNYINSVVERNSVEGSYAHANHQAVRRALRGMGPDSDKPDQSAGARMVVNIPSVHVPAFCEAARRGKQKPYKNCYDLEVSGADNVSPNRMVVDEALPLPAGADKKNVYFGAVELNGAGIRFYGDFCLVLKRDAVDVGDSDDAKSVLLDRNSYELIRAPIADQIKSEHETERAKVRKCIVQSWSGLWAKDLGAMAALRVFLTIGTRARRWTIGQMSAAIRDDEDYMEVLRMGSFGTAQLQEARVSSSDAAQDALVGSRLRLQPPPRLEALIWRNRRSRAEAALRAAGVPVRIVTTSGRTRGGA